MASHDGEKSYRSVSEMKNKILIFQNSLVPFINSYLCLQITLEVSMSHLRGKVIEKMIYVIRDQKVMLDKYLAELYEVETRITNRNVQRNIKRFPSDFMFQLNEEEYHSLRSQIGISKKGKGGRRYLPYVFTENGVAMLSSVLSSDKV
jgi:hypothetical protein